MKQCGRCGSDISHRAPQARFCEDPECHRQRMLAFGRQTYHQHREQIREQQNAAYRARVAARPKKVRTCAYCGIDISDRGPNAKWCNLRCRDKARHRADPTRARRRAAQRRSVPGNGIAPAQWLRLIRRFGHRCAYCGTAAPRFTQDHVVPLSRGGWDGEGNILPVCASCNCEKADRLLVEWKHGRPGKRPGACRQSIDNHEYPQDASSLYLVNTTPATG